MQLLCLGLVVMRCQPLRRALAGKLKEQFYSCFVVRALHLKVHVFQLSRQRHFHLSG
ncbi:acetyltransferase [Vibrio cholerae]|nr:acetyltransferase [Vibrio cholerae]TXY89407.1 acetyltransferase [Vibrio cholerae]